MVEQDELSRFAGHYRTGHKDWLLDFYKHGFSFANGGYWRASAYFSSNLYGQNIIKKSITEFVKKGGKIRLLTGKSNLREIDVEKARRAYELRNELELKNGIQLFLEELNPTTSGPDFLHNLIRFGHLDWKVVTRVNNTDHLYHEKIGFFIFNNDDFLYFNGSLNETYAAAKLNHESVDVKFSKESPEYCTDVKTRFLEMWLGADENLNVESIQTAEVSFRAKRQPKVLNIEQGGQPDDTLEQGDETMEELTLRDYQENAVNSFLSEESQGKGILSMATGTGKTRTANYILKYLFEHDEIDSAIVSVENVPVLNQWNDAWLDLKFRYNTNSIKQIFCQYGSTKQAMDFLAMPKGSVLIIGRTNAKALALVLKRLTDDQKDRLLLIHDEVHGLGTNTCREFLKGHTDKIKFALGLSATWERFDDEETEFIDQEFGGHGKAVFSFELPQAIKRGFLVEFDYEYIPYFRTTQDAVDFESKLSGSSMPWEMEGVYKKSLAKVVEFENWAVKNPEKFESLSKSCVFFCKTRKQGDEVGKVLTKLGSQSHHHYYSEALEGYEKDPPDVLEKFLRGEKTILITAGKLDQGFDMPSLKNVVLMEADASGDPKQRRTLIQRIGRMLRADPHDSTKRGFVLDFVRFVREDGFQESIKNYIGDSRSNSKNEGMSFFDKERVSWLEEIAKTQREEEE